MKHILIALSLFSVSLGATANQMIATTIPDSEYTQEHALHDLDLLIIRMEESAKQLKEAARTIDRLQTIISNKENCND